MTQPVSDRPDFWNGVYNAFHRHDPPRPSIWNEEPTPFFTRSISWLRHGGVTTVMDAGCGDGRNLGPLIKAGFAVTGVDFSSTALACSAKNYPHASNLRL